MAPYNHILDGVPAKQLTPPGWEFSSYLDYVVYLDRELNILIYFNFSQIRDGIPLGWTTVVKGSSRYTGPHPVEETSIPDACTTMDERVAWAIAYWSME